MAEQAYGEDLAYIHDAGHGDFARSAAPVVRGLLGEAGFPSGRVIDLGCGSGILAGELSTAGYDVLGIDISPAMVALARQRAPAAEFRVESLLTSELPPCVAVTAIGECFNYLFDAGNTKPGLKRLLQRIHQALVPGGLLVFDVAGPGRVAGKGSRKSYREGDDWAVLVTVEEDTRRGVLTRWITSFRRVGELYRRDQEVHRLRLWRRAEMAELLREAGFRVRGLSAYGEWRFPRGWAGFVGRKAEGSDRAR